MTNMDEHGRTWTNIIERERTWTNMDELEPYMGGGRRYDEHGLTNIDEN